MLVAVVAVVVPLVSGFTPNALAISSSLTARPYQNIVLRSKRTSLLSVGTRNRNKGALGLTAGLDPGTPMPNLDALYFGGVLICWVGGGLLFIQVCYERLAIVLWEHAGVVRWCDSDCAQTYGGKVGLGNFLKSSTGPGSDVSGMVADVLANTSVVTAMSPLRSTHTHERTCQAGRRSPPFFYSHAHTFARTQTHTHVIMTRAE